MIASWADEGHTARSAAGLEELSARMLGPTFLRQGGFNAKIGASGVFLLKQLLAIFALALAAHAQKLNFDPDWKFIKADPPGGQRGLDRV